MLKHFNLADVIIVIVIVITIIIIINIITSPIHSFVHPCIMHACIYLSYKPKVVYVEGQE